MAGPCVLVLFGVTGDLASKKLLPAIYDLANRGLLPPGFSLVGFARRDWADEDFAQSPTTRSRRTPAPRSARRSGTSCRRASGSCPARSPTTPPSTSSPTRSRSWTRERGTGGNYAFYLSVPPKAFPQCGPAAEALRAVQPPAPQGTRQSWRRVVIEKPFGHDLASAQRAERDAETRSSRRTRCSGSTTTWARRPCRTCWRCGSPTRCSSRSGTAATSTTSRSRWPRTSASAAGPGTTTASARPGT